MDKLLAAFLKSGKRSPGQSSIEFVKRSIPKFGYSDWYQQYLDTNIQLLIDKGLVIELNNSYQLTSTGVNYVRNLVI